jgi:hypothetical protein
MATEEAIWGGKSAADWIDGLENPQLDAYDRGIAAGHLGEMVIYGKVKDRKSLSAIVAALTDATHSPRTTIRVRSYGSLGHVVKALNAKLTKDADAFERSIAAYLIRVITEKSAEQVNALKDSVAQLVIALSDTDKKVRTQAIQALRVLDPRRLEALQPVRNTTMIEVHEEDDDVHVLVDGQEVDVQNAEEGRVWAECELEALRSEVSTGFPGILSLEVRSEDGFGTYLFHEAVLVGEPDKLSLQFVCHHPNKYWEGRYGLATLLDATAKQIPHHEGFVVEDMELEDDWKRLVVSTVIPPDLPLTDAIRNASEEMQKVLREAEVALGGLVWKKEFETDEKLFCTEVLSPLLRRLGFLNVRFSHGAKEYGKDFTFSEMTPFGVLRHYGLQAKAGDISGKVNAPVNEIIGQIGDAFAMPYYEIGSKEPRYISTFIVAISGVFTSNAKDKIAEKIAKGIIGSVLFLDRESLIELIERCWLEQS